MKIIQYINDPDDVRAGIIIGRLACNQEPSVEAGPIKLDGVPIMTGQKIIDDGIDTEGKKVNLATDELVEA